MSLVWEGAQTASCRLSEARRPSGWSLDAPAGLCRKAAENDVRVEPFGLLRWEMAKCWTTRHTRRWTTGGMSKGGLAQGPVRGADPRETTRHAPGDPSLALNLKRPARTILTTATTAQRKFALIE
jgi:hypothetical protein